MQKEITESQRQLLSAVRKHMIRSELPLIKVKSLCEECGMNPREFYRYYRNIDALKFQTIESDWIALVDRCIDSEIYSDRCFEESLQCICSSISSFQQLYPDEIIQDLECSRASHELAEKMLERTSRIMADLINIKQRSVLQKRNTDLLCLAGNLLRQQIRIAESGSMLSSGACRTQQSSRIQSSKPSC